MWFGASQDQEDIFARLIRACDGADGHWVLREPMILSWLDQSRDNQFLWLHGKPGAGEWSISLPEFKILTQLSCFPFITFSAYCPSQDVLTR